jgi:MarR family transcriptional regulator, transcriptional regulator for hemolysin
MQVASRKPAVWRPQDMPTLAINRIAKMLLRLDDERLKPFGVTSSQLPVLAALKNGERLTQKELAQLAGVEQPSMAQLLARMERDNLVRREPSPDDGRSSLVLLTDHALAQLEPGRDALRRIDMEACAGLSEDERILLLTLLKRVAVNVRMALPE